MHLVFIIKERKFNQMHPQLITLGFIYSALTVDY